MSKLVRPRGGANKRDYAGEEKEKYRQINPFPNAWDAGGHDFRGCDRFCRARQEVDDGRGGWGEFFRDDKRW